MKLIFLKLDGVRGESYAPRHIGEIELEAFNWGNSNLKTAGFVGGAGKSAMKDLVVYKQRDRTTQELVAAWTSGRHFNSGVLTIETVSKRGSLISAVAVHLDSVIIGFFSRPDAQNLNIYSDMLEQIELDVASIKVEAR